MTEDSLPAGWVQIPPDDQRKSAVVEYEWQPTPETSFIVSVIPTPTAETTHRIRLSTRRAREEHVRHDFPVDEYESEQGAREAATDFLEFLTARVEENGITGTASSVGEVRDAIDEFTDGSSRSPLEKIRELYR